MCTVDVLVAHGPALLPPGELGRLCGPGVGKGNPKPQVVTLSKYASSGLLQVSSTLCPGSVATSWQFGQLCATSA